MWGPHPLSGSQWKISLALKDPKLSVSHFTSTLSSHMLLCQKLNLKIWGVGWGRASKINRNWSYKVKKAGSHFLLSVRFWMQAFFHDFWKFLMYSKDIFNVWEQHLQINISAIMMQVKKKKSMRGCILFPSWKFQGMLILSTHPESRGPILYGHPFYSYTALGTRNPFLALRKSPSD